MEMVRRLGLGVIGLGYFGRRHASVYSSLPHVRLVAVADVNADHGLDVAGRLGAAFHAEFDELLARGDVDAVSICLPDRLHEAAAIAAARAGKHILLEKPLAHPAAAALAHLAADTGTAACRERG